MKDQRGPAIHALSQLSGRRYWRFLYSEESDFAGWWYFECVRDDGQFECIRQIQPRPGGTSAYDWQHLEDEHGFLTDQPFDPAADNRIEEISAGEFSVAWAAATLS